MLYEISVFWDRRYPGAKATAHSAENSHWVRIEAPDAAQFTIFVPSQTDADELAALINRLVSPANIAAAA